MSKQFQLTLATWFNSNSKCEIFAMKYDASSGHESHANIVKGVWNDQTTFAILKMFDIGHQSVSKCEEMTYCIATVISYI